MKALFESVNLIGDALYISPALRAWIRDHQHDGNLDISLLTLNDHVAPLYEGMLRDDDYKTILKENRFHVIFEEPTLTEENKYDFRWKFDVNAAFKLSDQKHQHLAQSYADLLGVKLKRKPGGQPRKYMPVYKPTFIPDPSKPGYSFDEPWYIKEEGLEDIILISMFSMSCTSHDPKCNYIPNKCLPLEKWLPMLKFLHDRFPDTPIRFLGAPSDQLSETIRDTYGQPLFGIPLNTLALIMRKAKLLVTIDNGMSHLAASQECPTFLMYPQCLAPYYILPVGNPNMTYIQMNPVTVKTDYLVQALEFSINFHLCKEKK